MKRRPCTVPLRTPLPTSAIMRPLHDLAQAVAHLEPQAKARRVRELFYERKAQQMRDICPWLTPPSLPRPSNADIGWRWQLQCQMSWYVAGQRCHYTPLTTGRRCNHQLGQHSDHVHACAHTQAASVRRHNRMRDVWHQLCRQAGWHAQTEQLVFTRDGTCKRGERAPSTHVMSPSPRAPHQLSPMAHILSAQRQPRWPSITPSPGESATKMP